MKFVTQRELLEYAWKNPDDRSQITRRRKSWKVYKEDWMWVLVEDVDIHNLMEEVERLKVGNKSEWVDTDMDKYKTHIKQLEEENMDLRRHLMYLWGRNDHKNECMDWMVQSFFNKNRQQYDYEGAKEKFYSLIKYQDDPLEWEERQWAIDNSIILN